MEQTIALAILGIALIWYIPKRFGSWRNFFLWEE